MSSANHFPEDLDGQLRQEPSQQLLGLQIVIGRAQKERKILPEHLIKGVVKTDTLFLSILCFVAGIFLRASLSGLWENAVIIYGFYCECVVI